MFEYNPVRSYLSFPFPMLIARQAVPWALIAFPGDVVTSVSCRFPPPISVLIHDQIQIYDLPRRRPPCWLSQACRLLRRKGIVLGHVTYLVGKLCLLYSTVFA